jgi:hypothetical protein
MAAYVVRKVKDYNFIAKIVAFKKGARVENICR